VYGCDLFYWSEWKIIESGRFCRANVVNLPFADGSFDTVLSFNVLEHIQPVEHALRELWRICCGHLILSVPNCQRFPEMEWAGLSFYHWVDRSHAHFFQAQDLEKTLVEAGFDVELLEPYGAVRPEILLLRSLGVPMIVARGMAWVLQKVSWRVHYAPLLLAVARVS
jgi:SAM-dependent methyltransferase